MTCWVLLRGLSREARHWGTFPGRLERELGDATIATPDLPGNGDRCLERSPVSIDGCVESLRATLRSDGHSPPYVLFGLSLGGMVALAWAARYPGEVRGMVLVNTSTRGSGPWHRRLRWRRLPDLLRIASARHASTRERRILELTSRHAPEPREQLVETWAQWRQERPVSLSNALRQLVASARFEPPPQSPAAPVLVLASAGDALVDPTCSAVLAAACGARLVAHPSAGHDLPLDDPDWVAETAAAWWRGL